LHPPFSHARPADPHLLCLFIVTYQPIVGIKPFLSTLQRYESLSLTVIHTVIVMFKLYPDFVSLLDVWFNVESVFINPSEAFKMLWGEFRVTANNTVSDYFNG